MAPLAAALERALSCAADRPRPQLFLLLLQNESMPCCTEMLKAAENQTGCECAVAGWCERHKIYKVAHFHKLCRTHIGYFLQYERGEGPGQNQPAPEFRFGLGDLMAWLLSRVGINPWPGCGCAGRKATL